MTKYAHAILVHACLNKPTKIVGFRTVCFVGVVCFRTVGFVGVVGFKTVGFVGSVGFCQEYKRLCGLLFGVSQLAAIKLGTSQLL